MSLLEDLSELRSIFIDTAPIIYFIEANPQFGPLAKDVVHTFQAGNLIAFCSVITLVEVLPRPVETGDDNLAKRFIEFLKAGKNMTLLEISAEMAELAGYLRGRYSAIRTMDAIQISAALKVRADAFITNDARLKTVRELRIMVLKDYV